MPNTDKNDGLPNLSRRFHKGLAALHPITEQDLKKIGETVEAQHPNAQIKRDRERKVQRQAVVGDMLKKQGVSRRNLWVGDLSKSKTEGVKIVEIGDPKKIKAKGIQIIEMKSADEIVPKDEANNKSKK